MPIVKKNLGLVNVVDFGAKGDGVADDTHAFQMAIIHAKNNNIKSVFVPPSQVAYMIDVTRPVYVPSNITISGVKGQSKIKAIPTTIKNAPVESNLQYLNTIFVTGDTTTRTRYLHSNQGYNIHFKNLVIDGSGPQVDQTNYTFNKSGNGSGIRGFFIRGFSIMNCEVINCMGSGIYTYGCTAQVIGHNIVANNGLFEYNARNGYSYANGLSRNGISLAGGYEPQNIGSTTPYPYSHDAIVTSNTVYDNVDEGIMFAYQKRLLITNNIVHNNGDRGIEGDSGYSTSDVGPDVNGDVTISYNQVYDHVFNGISVDSSNNQKINVSHNVVRKTGAYGIYVGQKSGAEVKISDNMLFDIGTDLTHHAITAEADEVTIQNNVIRNCSSTGVNVPRAINALITGNKVSLSKSHGINANLWNQAVSGGHMNSLVISDNIVNKSTLHGINVDTVTDTNYNRIRSIVIKGNSVFNYNEGSALHLAYGIYIRANVYSDSVIINSNSITEDRATRLGANAIFFGSTTAGRITSATIVGNEVSSGSDWLPIEGTQYITWAVVESNNLAGQRVVRGTGVPTANRWQIGDKVMNSAPSVGSPEGWICVATGTPGTWEPFGFIAGGLPKVNTLPIADATQRGRQVRVDGVTGVAEVASLTLTAGCTTAGNVTLNVEGKAYTVALTTADNTATLVATKIRAAVIPGWVLSGTGANVIFTRSVTGAVADITYAVASTGAAGTITITTQGVTPTADSIYTCVKLGDDTYDWAQIF